MRGVLITTVLVLTRGTARTQTNAGEPDSQGSVEESSRVESGEADGDESNADFDHGEQKDDRDQIHLIGVGHAKCGAMGKVDLEEGKFFGYEEVKDAEEYRAEGKQGLIGLFLDLVFDKEMRDLHGTGREDSNYSKFTLL